ncbi:Potassium efflux system KefA protein [Fulvivirga imtechensis AK7]|uniref:Potassium efflux system KefA protein n=1 Tax=Fulvivirga imtechensis AK7 TaxID=1237149 RepID=L8JL61_9BACT|nr:mechanosensitive ion channel family protein [Fulvivirga imtechensis]ELR69671.1 Potassium efflux system KefA protein [Fulvivirga imtechensis AK7]
MKTKFAVLWLILVAFHPALSQSQKADTVPKVIVVANGDSSALPPQDTSVVDRVEQKMTEVPKLSDIISLGKIFWSLVFMLAGYILVRFLDSILGRLAEKSPRYRITIKGLIPVINIAIWLFIIFIIIAGVFHPPIATVLAVTASVGIAVGFAAQDILKNIFGGIMILFDRPFQVGDKIEVGSHYGEVVEIGLRSTRIVTPDDSLVTVPNSEIMNTSVSNSNSGETNCQVVAEIYLPITVDTDKVRQIAMEAAQVSRFVFLNKPIVVLFFNEVKERRSYLKMRLKAYVSDIRYEFAFKSDMTEIVMRELIREKVVDPEDLS